MTASYISRIESGERRPSLRALRMLADKLEVSPEYLETGRERRPQDERHLRLADAELSLRLGDDRAGAEQTLRELHEEARRAGDIDVTVRAQIGLGLAAAQAGRYAEAIHELEQPVHEGWVTPTSRPDVYLTLGQAYAATNRHEQAIELFEHCLDVIARRAPGDEATQVRFVTYLSYALSDLGELARAREVLSRLEGEASLRDPYSRVRIYWSLARLAAMEGQTADALAHLRRAIVLLEATEDTLQQALAHLLCSEILLLDGQAEQAGEHLDRAERLFEIGGSARDLGAVRSQQAKRAAMLGRPEEAISRAREALGFLEEHPAEKASAFHALGLAHALKGEVAEADASFRRAADLLAGSGAWRESVQVCEAWAAMLRGADRPEEADEVLARAEAIGARAGAHRTRQPSNRPGR